MFKKSIEENTGKTIRETVGQLKLLLTMAANSKTTLPFILLLRIIASIASPLSPYFISLVIALVTKGVESDWPQAILLIVMSSMATLTSVIISNITFEIESRFSLEVFRVLAPKTIAAICGSSLPKDRLADIRTAFSRASRAIEGIVFRTIDYMFGETIKLLTALAIIFVNFGIKYTLLMMILSLLPLLAGLIQSSKYVSAIETATETDFDLNSSISSLVDNIALVKIHHSHGHEIRLMDDVTSNSLAKWKTVFRKQLVIISFNEFWRTIINVTLLSVLVFDIYAGTMDIAGFFLFTSYVMLFVGPIANFPTTITFVKSELLRIKPLLDLSNVSPPKPGRKFEKIDQVTISDFSCSYLPKGTGSGKRVFKRGEIYWLDAHNGAGKSSFIRTLFGMEPEGKCKVEIKLANSKTHKLKSRDCIASFSYATQNEMVWKRSVAENIIYPENCEPSDHEALRTKYAGLIDQLNLEDDATNLSGGQRQLVHTLRALNQDKEVIFLDEPTNALDGVICKKLAAYIKSISKDKIIIFASHDRYFQEIATKIAKIF